MSLNIIYIIFFILAFALAITVIFRFLKLPVILGYIVVGVLVGPHSLKLITDPESIHILAEFGVVFLLFTVGLKFSLQQIIQLKVPVFVLGGLQVCLTIIITTLIGIFIGMNNYQSFAIGSIAAMSSTAIVLKQLASQKELGNTYARNAMSILLFQDLSVVPLIILIASFSKGHQSIAIVLALGVVKGMIALIIIFVVGRWVLKPLFHLIAKTQVIEIFTLAVLMITVSAAILTNILGLSYALGAFLAGIMLSEIEYRNQIEVEIRPFRDILLGIFFISIGMMIDVTTWHSTWAWILLLLMAMIVGKSILVIFLSRFSGVNMITSMRTGLVLAQGGEFGFAILTLALSTQVIPNDYGQVILSALLISMLIAPLIIRFNERITEILLPGTHASIRKKSIEQVKQVIDAEKSVIICGYGRVGKQVAELLKENAINYFALEWDPNQVQRAKQRGERVIYGDATHPEIIKSLRFSERTIVVICIEKTDSVIKSIMNFRQINLKIPIIARCHDVADSKHLLQVGASTVIPEILDSSYMLAYHVLSMLDMSQMSLEQLFDSLKQKHDNLFRRSQEGM